MELISQISSSQSPESLVQQFVQTIFEHPDNLKESLRRLYNALRAKNPRHRANIAFALTQLLQKMKKDLDLDFVYEFSKDVLYQDSSTADHRRSMIALFFSWNAMCRAGIFKNRHDIIEKIIQNLFGISNERICFRLIGYETIWSVIDSTYKSTPDFQKELYDNIVNEMGQTATPPHAESFALWIRINRKFPGLPLKKWASTPCSSGTFRSFSSLLEKTVSYLPKIHPVWTVLASVDANQMVYNVMELWGSSKLPDGYIPMTASIAAFEYLEVQHFIKILENNYQYYVKISKTKYSDLFSEAALKSAERFAKIHKHRVVSIAAAIIRSVRSAQLGKFLGTFSDGETRELLNYMSSNENYCFGDFLELLWAQTRREALEDTTIVTDIFNQMMKKLGTEEDRKELIPFLCHISELVAGDGKHWFTLISPESEITGIIIQNSDVLIKRCQLILQASNKIHSIVGIEHEIELPEITDLDSLIECSLQLLQSNCKFCQSIGRYFAQSSLPFIDQESISKFNNEPLILVKALSRPELSEKVLMPLFNKTSLLPRTILTRPEKIVLNIDQEGIKDILPHLLSFLRSSKPVGFQIAILQMLIDKLDEENRQQLLEQVMEEQLTDKKLASSDFIPMFIKSSLETANHTLNLILEKLKTNKTQAMSRRARGWFEEVSVKYNLPPEKISETLAQLLDIDFNDSKLADRKKAEEILGWVLGFLSMCKDIEIPNDPWTSNLERFANSQSRKLKTLVEILRNPETVINDDENEENDDDDDKE